MLLVRTFIEMRRLHVGLLLRTIVTGDQTRTKSRCGCISLWLRRPWVSVRLGRKLVHLNGTCSDNRLVNLAYVPESDPRPAAPLRPRPPDSFTKAVAGKAAKSPAGGKKRRKGKRKHH